MCKKAQWSHDKSRTVDSEASPYRIICLSVVSSMLLIVYSLYSTAVWTLKTLVDGRTCMMSYAPFRSMFCLLLMIVMISAKKHSDYTRSSTSHSEHIFNSLILYRLYFILVILQFLPRCMECRRGLAMRFLSVCLSLCLSVCLSVRLSVKRVHCNKTEEKSVQIFIPCERSFSLVLWEEEWLVGGDPFYLKFWVNRPALERNRRFSTDNRSWRLSRTS